MRAFLKLFVLLAGALNALPQANPVLWLDFEAPDAFFSGSTYNEGGISFAMEAASNTGSASWGLSTSEFDTGAQSIYLTIPACAGCTVDSTVFSRREWQFGNFLNNQTYWVSFKVFYNTNHENPGSYGRVMSQVKIASGYGFQFAIYEMVGSASADIPIGIRYFERTGSTQGQVIFDSGEVYSGVSLARNQWHEIKYQFRNDDDAGDAFIRLYINDVLAIERTGLHVDAYSSTRANVRLGSYSRYEPRRVEKRYDNFRFGLTEEDVDSVVTPPDPPDPPADSGEFDAVALASNIDRYFHIQTEAVVNSTNDYGLVVVTQGDPSPLAADEIVGGPAVHFGTNGLVYARNYGTNAARSEVSFTTGTTNILDFYITTETQRYDVWITPLGGSSTLLARNYGFTNVFNEYSHVGWTTNMTATVEAQTNITRSGTVTTMVAGTPE